MNPHRNEERWIADVRERLDASADALDAATLSRLNRSRQAALAAARRESRAWRLGFAGLGAGALAAVIAIGLASQDDVADAPAPQTRIEPGDLDLVTGEEDSLDLYENLDFYAWLETRPDAKDANG